MNKKIINKKVHIIFGILIILFVAILFMSIVQGSVKIPLSEVINSIMSKGLKNSAFDSIIWKIRLPRVLGAIICGASLAIAGILLQVLFKNPLVDSYILGISSGASLATALFILGGIKFGLEILGTYTQIGIAFMGAILVMGLVLLISRKIQNSVSLLVIGLMMGYIASAITSGLVAFAEKEALHGYVVWTMGSYASMSWEKISILYLILIPLCISIMAISKPLNALLLGENYAKSMGVNIKRIRGIIIVVSSLLTAMVTAFTGPISFIGLAVPHISRLVFKTSNNKILIPGTLLIGAMISMFCDMIARTLVSPAELPLSSVTSVIGAPIVIYLILKRRSLV